MQFLLPFLEELHQNVSFLDDSPRIQFPLPQMIKLSTFLTVSSHTLLRHQYKIKSHFLLLYISDSA